jgi:hypothetical protein
MTSRPCKIMCVYIIEFEIKYKMGQFLLVGLQKLVKAGALLLSY